jgi:hypothetical protein
VGAAGGAAGAGAGWELVRGGCAPAAASLGTVGA